MVRSDLMILLKELGTALMKQAKTASNRGDSALTALALCYFLAR